MMKTLALLLSVSLAACAGEAAVRYSGDATTPELVAIDVDPSVMVVANADEPIFYTENTYYLYRNDRWYRSSSHRDGWKRVDTTPEHLRRIEQPRAYVHYRPNPNAPRTTFNQRDQAAPAPVERDQPDRQSDTPPREPNPQGPAQPYANPLPPQQVPPTPESSPTLDGPRNPRKPDQVPPVNPERRDTPNSQIAPDPDRAPTSPGMDNRAPDQRPASDRDAKKPGDRKPEDPKPEDKK
jgi:hypothetical protein